MYTVQLISTGRTCLGVSVAVTVTVLNLYAQFKMLAAACLLVIGVAAQRFTQSLIETL